MGVGIHTGGQEVCEVEIVIVGHGVDWETGDAVGMVGESVHGLTVMVFIGAALSSGTTFIGGLA